MKLLFAILFISVGAMCQTPKATLRLTNGQYINNAPTGLDWQAYKVDEVTVYEVTSDTSVFDNSALENINYYGKWTHAAAGCFCSYSNTANDSIVFMFTDATNFEWRGELMSHHGIAAIHFDGKYIGDVDTYDTRNLAQTRNWKAENLDPAKVYKFKLVVTGKKNAASTGAFIVNHGFRIIKSVPCKPTVIYKTDTLWLKPDTIRIMDTIWMKPEIFINYKKVE